MIAIIIKKEIMYILKNGVSIHDYFLYRKFLKKMKRLTKVANFLKSINYFKMFPSKL